MPVVGPIAVRPNTSCAGFQTMLITPNPRAYLDPAFPNPQQWKQQPFDQSAFDSTKVLSNAHPSIIAQVPERETDPSVSRRTVGSFPVSGIFRSVLLFLAETPANVAPIRMGWVCYASLDGRWPSVPVLVIEAEIPEVPMAIRGPR